MHRQFKHKDTGALAENINHTVAGTNWVIYSLEGSAQRLRKPRMSFLNEFVPIDWSGNADDRHTAVCSHFSCQAFYEHPVGYNKNSFEVPYTMLEQDWTLFLCQVGTLWEAKAFCPAHRLVPR